MGLERFDIGSLSTIDGGRINAAFEQLMKRCEDDCKDRPALEEARKLTLSISCTPVVDDAGNLESCNVQFQFAEKIPNRKSKIYNMRAERGGLVFNEMSPEDVRQMTIGMAPKPRRTGNQETHAETGDRDPDEDEDATDREQEEIARAALTR
jgi:predicted RND superfamily exporter protein